MELLLTDHTELQRSQLVRIIPLQPLFIILRIFELCLGGMLRMSPLGLKWLHKNTNRGEKREKGFLFRVKDTNMLLLPVYKVHVKCVTAEPHGCSSPDGAAHMKVSLLELTVLTVMDRASTLMMLRDLDRLGYYWRKLNTTLTASHPKL